MNHPLIPLKIFQKDESKHALIYLCKMKDILFLAALWVAFIFKSIDVSSVKYLNGLTKNLSKNSLVSVSVNL